jgi:hypothetical protein
LRGVRQSLGWGRWLAPGVQLSPKSGRSQPYWAPSPEFQEVGVGGPGSGMWAIPSPKRCSARRLGLANSYSAVAGWACGTERPDMAAVAAVALDRGAISTGVARPLQLPGQPGLSRSGGGVYTTQNSAERLGEGGEPGPRVRGRGCDQRLPDPLSSPTPARPSAVAGP